MPPIAVFDTNVVLSGVGWRGAPYRCLELARTGAVHGVTCQGLIDELAEKLEVRLRFSPAEIAATLTDLLSFFGLVEISAAPRVVPNDPDDDMVIECAITGGATHIITGDKRHLLPLSKAERLSGRAVTSSQNCPMNSTRWYHAPD